MRILAFDPGGDTGWALFVGTVEQHSITGGTLTQDDHHDSLWMLLNDTQPHTIVSERFVNSAYEAKGLLITVEYIGIIKLFHQLHVDDIDLIEQSPAQAKKFWTDDKLKRLGLYKPGASNRHEMDALRHLFQYLLSMRGPVSTFLLQQLKET